LIVEKMRLWKFADVFKLWNERAKWNFEFFSRNEI